MRTRALTRANVSTRRVNGRASRRLKKVAPENLRGTIHYGIITIRDDEFGAVLGKFRPRYLCIGEGHYNIAEFTGIEGRKFRAAIMRTTEQGHGQAQHAAEQMITDLQPACLVLVGIAGAKPEAEFTLGDVLVASRLYDFSVSAVIEPNRTELTNFGGPIHAMIQTAVANLAAVGSRLGPWNTKRAIGASAPPIDVSENNLIGDTAWRNKVKSSLEEQFSGPLKARKPKAVAATMGSGNVLMKSPTKLRSWLTHARDLKGVEMELPGIYAAAHRKGGDVPILAIRGISDVVGFQRASSWTNYACKVAASFARALLEAEVMEVNVRAVEKATRTPVGRQFRRIMPAGLETHGPESRAAEAYLIICAMPECKKPAAKDSFHIDAGKPLYLCPEHVKAAAKGTVSMELLRSIRDWLCKSSPLHREITGRSVLLNYIADQLKASRGYNFRFNYVGPLLLHPAWYHERRNELEYPAANIEVEMFGLLKARSHARFSDVKLLFRNADRYRAKTNQFVGVTERRRFVEETLGNLEIIWPCNGSGGPDLLCLETGFHRHPLIFSKAMIDIVRRREDTATEQGIVYTDQKFIELQRSLFDQLFGAFSKDQQTELAALRSFIRDLWT